MRKISRIITAGIAFLLAIQLIPYGRHQPELPVINEPRWNMPETRKLAKTACFDCHSNESVWPWYSRIAPISWLITYDVRAGRDELNFSEWQDGRRKAESASEIVKEISEGGMPPLQYRLAHPEASLSAADKKLLIDGFRITLQNRGPQQHQPEGTPSNR